MIDFSSLFVVAGLLLGLLAGDAALYGDTLRVQIDVPQSVSGAGFTETSAETVFSAEAARIVRGESIIPVPSLRVHTSTSVMTALAKPLNLDGVVMAVQNQLGIDHLMVFGALLATDTRRLDMLMVVMQPQQVPVQTVLEQPDGDATALVKRAASWAMEQVSPYRVVLAHFLAGLDGDQDGLAQARAAAGRFLGRPWHPGRASELALTHNLLALLLLLDDKAADAEAELALTDAMPGVLPRARAEVSLNHAFIAMSRGRLDEAAALLESSRHDAADLDQPDLMVTIETQQALLAWRRGDRAAAESGLRDVVAVAPASEVAHHYLALLLRANGDEAGAIAEDDAARIGRRFERQRHGIAVLQFWMDPVTGNLTRRL